MRKSSNQTSSIAWFKLADFVARGEKERALAMLRLLMHSVSHQALTYQLEGDILNSFDDLVAVDRYLTAATIFQKSGFMQQALSVYLQALSLKSDDLILTACAEHIALLGDEMMILHSFAQCIKVMVSDNKISQMLQLLEKINQCSMLDVYGLLHVQLVTSLMLYDPRNQNILALSHKAVMILSQKNNHLLLQKFITQIKALDQNVYHQIIEWL